MSLAEYYRSCPFAKTNRVVEQLTQDRTADAAERKCRQKVNDRDGHRCFWPGCKTRATDPHHLVLRSRGGTWRPSNIASSCRRHHDYVHGGLVRVTGTPPAALVVTLTALGVAAKIRLPRGP